MSFNNTEVEKLLADTGRLCCICNNRHQVQLHHIIPKEDGGTDDIDNAIPLCPNCHDEVHTGYVSGRVTKKYSQSELKLHRQRTIDMLRSNTRNDHIIAAVPIGTGISETETHKQFLRSQLKAELDQNLSMLREYKDRLFRKLPASSQIPQQPLYNLANLEIPLFRRIIWDAFSIQSNDALTAIEFQKVMAIYSQIDSIIGIKSAYRQYQLEEQKIPTQKSDLIKRNMNSSSMWDGLILQEKNITTSKTMVWMEMIEVFKKTLDEGNPII